jgi:ribosomal protein S18 acetylase RimI-like enzyme
MSLEIRRVETKADLRKFINFPFVVFKGNPNWIPPLFIDELNTLSKDRNPAFEFSEAEYWIAYRDGRPVGRIAGIINHRYVEKWGNKYGRFGWLDFIEDFEVASALMRTAEDWLRSKGMEGVVGPMGFTDLDKEGLLIEGFDELGTMPMIYNHPYYPEYLERLGYRKDIDWLEYEIMVPEAIPEKVTRVQELISKRTGIHLYDWRSPAELKRKYAKEVFALVDEAYAHLYGTTPLSQRQVDAYVKQYLGFADPRFMKIVVDRNDKLVAFGLSIPSLSRALQKSRGRLFPFGWYHLLRALKHPKGIDMLLVAIDPKQQSLGAVAFLITSIITSCKEAGVVSAESSGELETNHEVQSLWKDYNRRQHKRRRAYLKKL